MPAEKPSSKVAAIIVAAGKGLRFGGDLPKQYIHLGGEMILTKTVRAFLEHSRVGFVQVVIGDDHGELYREAVAALASPKLSSAPQVGGQTRQTSVLAGLDATAALWEARADIVLIHDAARPFVSEKLIDRAIDAAMVHGAAVPGFTVTDTIVVTAKDTLVATTDRTKLRAVQTPQAFRLDLIEPAHIAANTRGERDHFDDSSVARAAGHAVHVFEGDQANVKITTQHDLALAQKRLQPVMVSRTATGFDVHAFGPGDHVWLCGVKVPHSESFIAHSDGDVALHAITDALMGAMADGDIGRHFPPSDPQWKGASSDRFLAFAAGRLRQRGGLIDLLDVTIICEMPKIGPVAESMRRRVAEIAGITIDNVSVKATTTERLGFTGRKQGIAAMATATVRLPV